MTDHDDVIADVEQLRARYRDPTEAIAGKVVARVDDASARFLAASPFFVLATSSDDGADASPRGGPPGFVRVVDEGRRLAWGDLSGNNLLDSFTNVVQHPDVGLIFFVPGTDETVRVNGRASLSTDPELLAATTIDGRTAKVAMVVEVEQCFVHCAKALRRGGLWDPSTWPADGEVPTAGEIINHQHGLGLDPQVITDELEANYTSTMWEPGGET